MSKTYRRTDERRAGTWKDALRKAARKQARAERRSSRNEREAA